MKDDIAIINISGKLDIDTAPIFNVKVIREIKNGIIKFIICMDDIEYLASVGIGALINIRNIVKKRGGDVKICLSDRSLMDSSIKMSCLEDIFELFKEQQAAIESFD